jgi:hypothetical protein
MRRRFGAGEEVDEEDLDEDSEEGNDGAAHAGEVVKITDDGTKAKAKL